MSEDGSVESIGEGGAERHLQQAERQNLSPESEFLSNLLEASKLRSELNSAKSKEREVKNFAMKVRSAWKVAESIMVINEDAGKKYINQIINKFVEKDLFDKLRNKKMFYKYVNANPYRRDHYFNDPAKFQKWEDILKVLFRIADIYYSGEKRTLTADKMKRSYEGE